MITVTLNRTEFEYDIHSLIKAFFPKEDVELYYTKEAHADEKNVACTNHSAEQEEAGSSHFSIDYADAGGRDGTAAAMGYTDRYPSDEDSDADA